MRYILASFLIIQSCSIAPTVDSNWISSNCSPVYYAPTTCGNFSNCTCNPSTKYHTCKVSDATYVGQIKGNDYHGKGEIRWNDGDTFKGVFKDSKKWCGIERHGSTYFLYRDGVPTQGEEGVDWGLVAGAVIVGAAAYAIADSASSSGGSSSGSSSPSTCTYSYNYKEYTIDNPNKLWGGSCPSYHIYDEPEMCSIYNYSERECDIGKACGDTCISEYKTCHVGKGNACNKNYRSYP